MTDLYRHELRSHTESVGAALRQSRLLRLLALGFLTLVLLIPVDWIRELIAERSQRRLEAVEEVVSKWGRTQTLAGLALVVPYQQRRIETIDGKEVELFDQRYLTVLPDILKVNAEVDGEERYRGIFVVPVYRLRLDVSGELTLPDLKALRIEPSSIDWLRARAVVGLADARVIQNRAELNWNGEQRPFHPGAGGVIPAGIHATLAAPLTGKATFSYQLEANGSSGVYFVPLGQETIVTIESNWATPSFQGNWLPSERTVNDLGFNATWSIPFLGRSQPQAWVTASEDQASPLQSTPFGVDLLMPVDAHRMADRSVKYAQLFILFTFGTIWLIEVLAQVRVHPIQYLMIGAALCTFYLLELALAEQIGFRSAYALASTAVVVLIAAYAVAVLRGWSRAAGVAGLVSGLYVYLYVLLTNEDYALLLGSVGLFLALTVAMLLTRRIDWYESSEASAAGSSRALEA
jgi:inner membrane protein